MSWMHGVAACKGLEYNFPTSSGSIAFLKKTVQFSTISVQNVLSYTILSTKKYLVVQTTKSHDFTSVARS